MNGALFLIGGSKSKYRPAHDPSKVWVLQKNASQWRDDIIPPLIGTRMWPGCTLANVEGQVTTWLYLLVKFFIKIMPVNENGTIRNWQFPPQVIRFIIKGGSH